VNDPYYRRDLARIHHLGFGFHADACAPGILALLEPVRAQAGVVVEIGCGSGLLTRHLVDAGYRVIATDASPAMLDLAREIVPDAASLERALVAICGALRPGGLLVFDICGLDYGEARRGSPSIGRVGDDWAIVTEFPATTPDQFVRQMATFTRNDDGSWRREDERHDNVLIDIARVSALLAEHGVEATAETSFGSEQLPPGLYAVKGRRTG